MSTVGITTVGDRETVVSFLTQTAEGTYAPSQRIFDLEISSGAQDFYTDMVTVIDNALNGQIPAGFTGTTSSLATIANTPTSDWTWTAATGTLAYQAIQLALRELDAWSKMKSVVGGVELYGLKASDATNATVPVTFDPSTMTFVDDTLNSTTGAYQSPLSTGVSSTMNRYMAESLDKLIRTFRAAGWDPIATNTITSNTSTATAAISAVSTLTNSTTASIYSISDIITNALSVASSATLDTDSSTGSSSLQQILMVDYVSRGNELLFNQMSGLQDAINCNQTVLSYLNSLQDLMNQKDPAQFLLTLSDLNKATLAEADYSAYEKDTFNQTIGTVPMFSADQLASYVAQIQGTNPPAEGTAAATFTDLDGNVYSVDQVNNLFNGKTGLQMIEDNLNSLIDKATATAKSDASGLVSSLKTVLADFQNLSTKGIEEWVADTDSGKEGNYQQNLSNAIVSSQALNDTERENLRRVMFVYEEFYKSSTAMLNSLNQLLGQIAQAITR